MGPVGDDVDSREILRNMLSYVWPKDKPWIRRRVVLALSLLISSKVSSLSHRLCSCPKEEVNLPVVSLTQIPPQDGGSGGSPF